VARASSNKRDCDAWSLLLLAATVRSFAHMPLGISDRNSTCDGLCRPPLSLNFSCFVTLLLLLRLTCEHNFPWNFLAAQTLKTPFAWPFLTTVLLWMFCRTILAQRNRPHFLLYGKSGWYRSFPNSYRTVDWFGAQDGRNGCFWWTCEFEITSSEFYFVLHMFRYQYILTNEVFWMQK